MAAQKSLLRRVFDVLVALAKRLVLGLIEVTDPAEMVQFETSGAVDRLHALHTSELPLWVRLFFRGTRFYDSARDEWFVPFERAGEKATSRRNYVALCLYRGGAGGRPQYTAEDVARVAGLLKEGATDRMLGAATADIVGRLFTGKPSVPRDVVDAAQDLLADVGDAVKPGRYGSATASSKNLVQYAADACPATFGTTDACPIDIAHNISAATTALVAALRTLQQGDRGKTLVELFGADPPTKSVLRIAVEDTTVGKHRVHRGKTVVRYSLGSAAPVAKDPQLRYTFGVGRDTRVCPFREFFLAFLGDVRAALPGAAGAPAAPSGANGVRAR